MVKRKHFPLRIDPVLYEALEKWANDEFRSVNGHIEFILREALLKAGRLPRRYQPPDRTDREDDSTGVE